jgi:DNA polymerase-3 subunit alpha
MMGTEELESYFNYFSPEILQKAYASIEEIANKCENFSLLKPLKIPELKWKPLNNNPNLYYALKAKIPALEKFLNSPYKSDQYLVDAIIEGIESHPDLQNDEAYNEINSNLEMTWKSSEVNKTQWSAYYLNLQQIIDLCWEAGSIVGPGRGSGVGFILLYVLGITQINPLRETTRCFSWRLTLRV